MPEAPSVIATYGPYETVAIELIKFATTVIESQPTEVRAELWKMHLEDLKQWRAFWSAFRSGLGGALQASAK